jgi:hypothetical protein
MPVGFNIKSWLMPALFVLNVGFTYATNAKKNNENTIIHLASNPQWLGLLHLKNDIPQITDTKFILSGTNFSPLNEMYATLKLLDEDRDSNICRFPARYSFLNKHLNLGLETDTAFDHCSEFSKYNKAVPFDNISLIFASEVLSSASSMMGHSFLSVSGKNNRGNEVSHSLSFFSEISTFNPIKLIYDGTIGGMDGFLMVRPFERDYQRYLEVEGRNLWSYGLHISQADKQLIKQHIWELKDIEIEYLFQSYNCATLTLYILGLANSELRNEEILYVSPVDVVKAVDKYNMVISKEVTLADDWAFNMLSQEIDADVLKGINTSIYQGSPLGLSHLDEKSEALSRKYLSLLINKPSIKQRLSEVRYAELKGVAAKSNKIALDLTQYKDPLKTPQDSSIGVALSIINDEEFLELNILPAAHHLYADNRQFFSESELKIAELNFRTNLKTADSQLHSLVLYSVNSLIPSTEITPQMSGAFFMGFHHTLTPKLEEKGVFELSGAMGKTYQVHRDIMLYAMLGVGVATDIKSTFLFVEPYVGGIVNLVGDSKAIFDHRLTAGQFDSSSLMHTSSLTYAWYGLNDITVNISFESTATEQRRRNTLSIGLDYHF